MAEMTKSPFSPTQDKPISIPFILLLYPCYVIILQKQFNRTEQLQEGSTAVPIQHGHHVKGK